MRFSSVQFNSLSIAVHAMNDSWCKKRRRRRMVSLFWSIIRSRFPNLRTNVPDFIQLIAKKKGMVVLFFFIVCVWKVRLIIFNYEKNQCDLIRTQLIWFSILIGFCERSPWKIWCAFRTYSNSLMKRDCVFFSLSMRDLWMLTIASCPHLDFVTMFGFLLFCDCLVWLMAIGPSNGNCK